MKSVPLSKAVIPFLLLLDSFSLLANAKITPLSWKEAYSKAEKLVDQMSVEQMVKITTGQGWSKGLCVGQTYAIESPDFPSLCLQDGPLGVRLADNITAGVAGINAAASFDKNAIYERGRYMGQEFRGKGAHIQLGPVMNLMRSPEGGRGWEASGEDPFLSGVAAETIKGIQEEGVIATAKHYILNDQELNRTTSSSDIDDRSFHEVYLWPFARAVEAGVGSIMCSYNIINGTHACEDDHTLNTVLKGELGFKGFVQSDWGATHSTVNAANHGLDMDMPGTIGFDFKANASYFGKNLTNAVHDKKVKKERLSNMVTRIVAAWYKMRQDSGFPETTIGTGVQVNVQANHRKLVRSMGAAQVFF
ncbi:glycoside hydrolase superfamily [Gilbertella persicaria]|uniref:glycoside hydrolase superfamily n=1 Tax=Gilbertella persicaria TaxID=101096 RepID=UPI00221FADAE|nr:glycoside hydrolase superfamily [Gilbertella persicaria]KAI8047031.1 glycoside hydrolase superfamily [Gilbertella persicaria]